MVSTSRLVVIIKQSNTFKVVGPVNAKEWSGSFIVKNFRNAYQALGFECH